MQVFNSAPELLTTFGNIPLPEGISSDEDQICAFTGVTIPAGTADLVKLKLGATFTNQLLMADRCGQYISRAADAIVHRKQFISKLGFAAVSAEGWFDFKGKNQAWFLINPPSPPFVLSSKDTSNPQHILWFSPISTSRELFYVQFGSRTLKINRQRMLDFYEETKSFTELYKQFLLEKHGRKNKAKHPFRALDFNAKKPIHGKPTLAVYEMSQCDEEQYSKPALKWLDSLSKISEGELWGLVRLVVYGDELEAPEPLLPEQLL